MTICRTTMVLAAIGTLAVLAGAAPMAARPVAAAADQQGTSGGPAAVFTMLDGLVGLPRLSTADVSRLTGVSLSEAADSNQYFKIYRGTAPAGPIAGVELRVVQPGAAASAKDLVILTVAASVTIGVTDLTRRYGQIVDLGVPLPTAPRSAPEYYRYRVGQRIVSFGMTRTAPARATSVVLDLSRR